MKEYTFVFTLLLNNNICVYFLTVCARFSVVYERYRMNNVRIRPYGKS